MEKLYLPQDFTGVLEEDLIPYEDRATTAFAIGFTKNKNLEMNIGLQYKDFLNANLTAITWVEDSKGYYKGERLDLPSFDRIIKICTLYLDRGGFIVEGFYRAFKYFGEIQAAPSNMPSDARIEKKIRDEYNVTRAFKSNGMELHKEIFVDKMLRIEGFEDVKINSKSIYFNLLREVSIFNRCCDMNYVYAIANDEEETFENVKTVIGLAALPFTIEGGAFVKALQGAIGVVSYLCDIDSTFRLSSYLYEYKGPVVVSDVYWKNWKNRITTDDSWERRWQTPTLDPLYDPNDLGSKQDVLERFKNLKITLNGR